MHNAKRATWVVGLTSCNSRLGLHIVEITHLNEHPSFETERRRSISNTRWQSVVVASLRHEPEQSHSLGSMSFGGSPCRSSFDTFDSVEVNHREVESKISVPNWNCRISTPSDYLRTTEGNLSFSLALASSEGVRSDLCDGRDTKDCEDQIENHRWTTTFLAD